MASNLSLTHINVYTILLVVLFGVGYGIYYVATDMSILMVADCPDCKTYRSGKYVPGIMGALFSLVDKPVFSLSSAAVSLVVAVIGLSILLGGDTPYVEGMKIIILILLCVIPMVARALTPPAMKGYSLTDERVGEIQAVSAVREEATIGGMSIEGATERWRIIGQVPGRFC